MSVENSKACCNCRHCIRSDDQKYNIVFYRCEVFYLYLSHAEVMEFWCRRWAKKKEEGDKKCEVW